MFKKANVIHNDASGLNNVNYKGKFNFSSSDSPKLMFTSLSSIKARLAKDQ